MSKVEDKKFTGSRTTIVEDKVQFVEVNGKREFIIMQNGGLHWYKITPAHADDLTDIINAKPVNES